MMRCTVCGSIAVPIIGAAPCGYCGASDRPQVAAPRELPAHVAGGVMLSAIERGDYGRMFGLDALGELLGRGPEG